LRADGAGRGQLFGFPSCGWGKVDSEPLKVVSATRDASTQNEEYKIKSSVSGFTYTLSLFQAPKSNACVIASILSGDALTPVNSTDGDVKCESNALEAATHVDVVGFGKVDDEPLTVTSRKA
jgi:hypothetical protein